MSGKIKLSIIKSLTLQVLQVLLVAIFLLAVQGAHSAPVTIVQAVGTAPDSAERHYAKRVTARIDNWLQSAGVTTAVITDETAGRGFPDGSRVVILPYNPYPTPNEKRNLRAFIDKGGFVIVFYSSDSELAGMLGLKIWDYLHDPTGLKWNKVIFNTDSGVPHLPRQFRQTSRSLRPVYPNRADARVAAWWHDAESHRSDPAFVFSDNGAWMTHIMLDDADVTAKKQVLLALLSEADPDVWKNAASQAADDSRLPPSTDYSASRNALQHLATQAESKQQITTVLDALDRQYKAAQNAFTAGNYALAFFAFNDLRQMLIYSFARLQNNRANEIVAVWDHAGSGLYPGDWPRTARQLKKNGVTDVFTNLLWPGKAHYPSTVIPASRTFELYGDQLQQALEACHAAGIRLHAWKVCWNLEGASAEFVASMKKQGRLQLDKNGKAVNWLCPSIPANRRMEKDAVRELLRKYPVDGIHLDYIRFPDPHSCYCRHCRSGFEQHLGRKMNNWPTPVLEWPLRGRFLRWRAKLITQLVADISAINRDLRPDSLFSVAVFGKYPTCVESVAQDWGDWNRRGLVDMICPMNYTTDNTKLTQLLKEQTFALGSPENLLPGLGVTAAESRLNALQVIEQIKTVRDSDAAGFALFDLNPTLMDDILPVLRQGLIAPD